MNSKSRAGRHLRNQRKASETPNLRGRRKAIANINERWGHRGTPKKLHQLC